MQRVGDEVDVRREDVGKGRESRKLSLDINSGKSNSASICCPATGIGSLAQPYEAPIIHHRL